MPYADKIKQKEWQKLRARKRKDEIQALKDAPCVDCGKRYPPYVMEWDHLPNVQKVAPISHMTFYNFNRILEEISKCELVCSNCHRERTHKRGYK
jgi:hypothetical protein